MAWPRSSIIERDRQEKRAAGEREFDQAMAPLRKLSAAQRTPAGTPADVVTSVVLHPASRYELLPARDVWGSGRLGICDHGRIRNGGDTGA